MTILDTFYLLFKSNASGVEKDIDNLGAATDKLNKKMDKGDAGQKKARESALKDTQSQVKANNQLADSFLGIAGRIAAPFGIAFGAFETFNAAVGEAKYVNNYNTGLERMRMLTGQNVTEVSALGAALQQFGGSPNEVIDQANKLYSEAAKVGVAVRPIEDYYKSLNRLFQNKSDVAVGGIAASLGLSPQMILLLKQSPDKFDALIEKQKQLAHTTESGTKAAQDFSSAMTEMGISVDGVFSQWEAKNLPTITKYIKLMKEASEASSAPVKGEGMESYLAKHGWGGFLWESLKIGGGKIGHNLGIVGGAAATGAKNLAFGKDNHVFEPKEEKAVDKTPMSMTPPKEEKGINKQNLESSFNFWIKEGYTKEQAAGLVANEQAESGGHVGRVGDGGKAHGIAQWHPDRQANIFANTGIDVRTASHDDQLKAMAWELEHGDKGNIAAKLRNTKTAQEAGELITRKFEIPANTDFQAMKRGLLAADIAARKANSISATTQPMTTKTEKTINVDVNSININTNATDADEISKHISSTLNTHLQALINNNDDGLVA